MPVSKRIRRWVKRNVPFAVPVWEAWVGFLAWQRRLLYARKGREYAFTAIYKRGGWGGESLSGPGSTMDGTAAIRDALPQLFTEFGIRSMIDAPCGDFHWMRYVALDRVQYTGLDLVPKLIECTSQLYGNDKRRFAVCDLVVGPVPRADLFFCRDCLVHLALDEAVAAVRNIVAGGSQYVLCTTFPETTRNKEIVTGEWRSLNMQLPPFNFPPPLKLINENYIAGNGSYADKSIGLWAVADLKDCVGGEVNNERVTNA